MNEPYNLQGHVAIVDASVGIAVAPDDGTEPDILMKNADMALYRAKGEGRGTYRFFEPEMDARMQTRREAGDSALREALASRPVQTALSADTRCRRPARSFPAKR